MFSISNAETYSFFVLLEHDDDDDNGDGIDVTLNQFWKSKFISCSLHGDVRLGVRLIFRLFMLTKSSSFYFARFRIILLAKKIYVRIYAPKSSKLPHKISGIDGRSAQLIISNFLEIVDYVFPPCWVKQNDPSVSELQTLCSSFAIQIANENRNNKKFMMERLHEQSLRMDDDRRDKLKQSVSSLVEVMDVIKYGPLGHDARSKQQISCWEDLQNYFQQVDGLLPFFFLEKY